MDTALREDSRWAVRDGAALRFWKNNFEQAVENKKPLKEMVLFDGVARTTALPEKVSRRPGARLGLMMRNRWAYVHAELVWYCRVCRSTLLSQFSLSQAHFVWLFL